MAEVEEFDCACSKIEGEYNPIICKVVFPQGMLLSKRK